MNSITEIDERAQQMSDDDRDDYLTAAGWQNTGMGWLSPSTTEKRLPGGGVILTNTSGLFSRSTAIREQLAREQPDAVPNELGRYYHGTEPENAFGKRW
jgi:hypothetical protein